jgi:glutamate formiminotransferase/glutamate formiminotransferase/formiminotetrahydrofolate cyclodeaminase
MCKFGPVLECVVNISEGRQSAVLAELTRVAGPCLLDRHTDAGHHRSVFTLAGPLPALRDGVQDLTRAAVARLDLAGHSGVHPRIGLVDVVPWVAFEGWPLRPAGLEQALAERDRFAAWAGSQLKLPCFLYGPERALPEIRRRAWRTLLPDTGPPEPHPTAGASAIGARGELVAYNLWLAEPDLRAARSIAAGLRSPTVRALGLSVEGSAQISCNLVAPSVTGIDDVYDAVACQTAVIRAELVGLLRTELLMALPAHRWTELGVGPSSTIEARLAQAGLAPTS